MVVSTAGLHKASHLLPHHAFILLEPIFKPQYIAYAIRKKMPSSSVYLFSGSLLHLAKRRQRQTQAGSRCKKDSVRDKIPKECQLAKTFSCDQMKAMTIYISHTYPRIILHPLSRLSLSFRNLQTCPLHRHILRGVDSLNKLTHCLDSYVCPCHCYQMTLLRRRCFG